MRIDDTKRSSNAYLLFSYLGMALMLLGFCTYSRPENGAAMATWLPYVAIAFAVAVVAVNIWAIIVKRIGTPLMAARGMVVSVLLFSSLYYAMGGPPNFAKPLSHIDAVYFTLTTFATVGYGDISPLSQLSRASVSAQIIINFVFLIFVLSVALNRLEPRERYSRSATEHSQQSHEED